MTDKLKVYLETSFVNYLTGRSTSNVKIASEQAYTRQDTGDSLGGRLCLSCRDDTEDIH